MKAIALLSGGLDSTLAARVLLDQGIELEALNFLTVFCTCTQRGETCLASQKAVEALGIPLKVMNVSESFLEVVKRPKHGYGSNMNPCIDCRIFMLKKAKATMEMTGARFVITGEVLGQRPMSQRRDALRLVEKESGLNGLILRPLSAKFLPPTIPEKEGWVDREKLLSIHGRSRKEQIRMATQFGIHDYPCPAGGCLLTDPGFARRLRDLMNRDPEFTLNDVHLLKMGRHFRLSPALKLVVGRNEEENLKIQTFSRKGDLVLETVCHAGPLSLLRGKADEEEVYKAAAITARYTKLKDSTHTEILVREASNEDGKTLLARPALEVDIKEWIIG